MSTRPQRLLVALATAVVSSWFGGSAVGAQLPDAAMTDRIIEEGQERSQALHLFHTLTDVYGARLTGSPEYTASAEWVRDLFGQWGLTNPRLEAFDFGPGWTLDKLSVEMTSPRYMPLIGYADAWSPSVDGVVEGRVVYVGGQSPR